MQTWNNIAGNELWVMTSSGRYPNQPDTTVKIDSLECPKAGNNLPDSYGLRMTTYYKVKKNLITNSCRVERVVMPLPRVPFYSFKVVEIFLVNDILPKLQSISQIFHQNSSNFVPRFARSLRSLNLHIH